jgi:hypothetical protein
MDSVSRMRSTGSGTVDAGRSAVEMHETSLEEVGVSSGREGSSEINVTTAPDRSVSLLESVAAIDSVSGLKID